MSLENAIAELAEAVRQNTLQMVTLTKYTKQLAGGAKEADNEEGDIPGFLDRRGENTEKPAKAANTAKPEPKAKKETATAPAKEQTPAVNFQDVKTVFLELTQKKGKDVALDVLADFSVSRASELSEREYGAAIAAAKAKLSE